MGGMWSNYRSREQAVKRYLSNEHILNKEGKLTDFEKGVREYFDLGHAECGKILPHFQELFIIVCMHVTIYVYTLFFLFQLCISFAHTKLFGRHILFCITQVVRFKTSIA